MLWQSDSFNAVRARVNLHYPPVAELQERSGDGGNSLKLCFYASIILQVDS